MDTDCLLSFTTDNGYMLIEASAGGKTRTLKVSSQERFCDGLLSELVHKISWLYRKDGVKFLVHTEVHDGGKYQIVNYAK